MIKHNRKIIFLAGFIFSIPMALTSYVNSSRLEEFGNDYFVSALYVVASLLSIWAFFEMPRFLEKFGNRPAALFGGGALCLSLFLLAFTPSAPLAIFAFLLYFIASNTLIASLDIFVEDFSKSSSIGKFRGLYLSIMNGAWVVAQAVSGSIIAKSSFKGIYLFSALIMLLFIAIFIFFLPHFKDPKYAKIPIKKTLLYFWKNKNISKIYLINLILKFFFAWMVIYTPIYLHEYIGFAWDKIGLIFTIMLLPFVFIEFPLGRLSDKIGEKKILLIGFALMFFFTFMIPLIPDGNWVIWAIVLFGTRLGAASVEVMSESYFFKEVSAEKVEAISFFRNTYPFSYLLAPFIALPVLFFIPEFKYLFSVLAIILLLGFWLTLRLRDVK